LAGASAKNKKKADTQTNFFTIHQLEHPLLGSQLSKLVFLILSFKNKKNALNFLIILEKLKALCFNSRTLSDITRHILFYVIMILNYFYFVK